MGHRGASGDKGRRLSVDDSIDSDIQKLMERDVHAKQLATVSDDTNNPPSSYMVAKVTGAVMALPEGGQRPTPGRGPFDMG